MTIKIEKKEDRKVTMDFSAKDENGNVVMNLNAVIGTGTYECGSCTKTIINKQEYFKNLDKYKEMEKEFNNAYDTEATQMFEGLL